MALGSNIWQGLQKGISFQFKAEDEAPISINYLIDSEISKSDLECFETIGFCTVQAIAYSSQQQLRSLKGLTDSKKLKVVAKAKKFCPIKFTPANILMEQRENLHRISTGSRALDSLLHGGVEMKTMTEFFGDSSSGKTMICSTLCVTCQLPMDKGGMNGKAVYIDTEGSFRPELLKCAAIRFGLDPTNVLANVAVSRAFSSQHQMDIVLSVAKIIASDKKIVLVVVDSATALFRTEYSGRAELPERQAQLGNFLRMLRRLSDEFGVACVYSNQVVCDVGGASSRDIFKPSGGNVLSHAATIRLSLRKGSRNQRICKVYSSPTQDEVEEVFMLTEAGVDDVKD